MKASLKVINGPDAGSHYQIKGATCNIGRSRTKADFIISNDPYISGCHCKIAVGPDGYWIIDHNSRNHTYVNDNVCIKKRLKDNDIIRIGFTRIQFCLEKFNVKGTDTESIAARTPVCCVCGNRLFQPGEEGKWEKLGVYCCNSCLPREEDLGILLNTLENYRLIRKIGSGGMCIVFLAATPVDSARCYRLTAVRRLSNHSHLSDNGIRQRFERAYELFHYIKHPNVVAFHNKIVAEDVPHIIMEYAPAGTLNDLILKRGRPLEPDAAVNIILQLLFGLKMLHENTPPMYHRDIKPHNILVRAPGKAECALKPSSWDSDSYLAQLADFDLVKKDSVSGMLTTVGTGIGTYEYSAPENFQDASNVSAPSDLFSVGIVLHYLLTGRLPYNYPSELEIHNYFNRNRHIFKNMNDALDAWKKEHGCPSSNGMLTRVDTIPLRPERDNLPRELCDIVNRLIIKDARKRFQTVAETISALETL